MISLVGRFARAVKEAVANVLKTFDVVEKLAGQRAS